MKKIVGLSITGLLLTGCGNNETATSNVVEEEQNTVTVEVEFNIEEELYEVDEESLEQEFELTEGTTVLEAMKTHYDLQEEEGFITSIEGYEQDEAIGAYWMYEVNGEMAQVGAAEYVLEDGDEVSWDLESDDEN